MQKLQDKVAKLESVSSEATRANQAESARITQAEAARYAQTEAVVDSLLAFKQTQAAELAKRDDAIVALHGLVAQLQVQLQDQGSDRDTPPLQLGSPDGQVSIATAQLHQQIMTNDQALASSSKLRHERSLESLRRTVAPTWRQGAAAKGAVSKGRVRLSSDGRLQSQQAARKGQGPVEAATSLTAALDQQQQQQRYRQPLSEVVSNEASIREAARHDPDVLVSTSFK